MICVGNVATDQDAPYAAAPYPRRSLEDPVLYAVRGGSWNDDSRRDLHGAGKSERHGKADPQLPEELWYMTDAQWLGFRLVRPARLPERSRCIGRGTTGWKSFLSDAVTFQVSSYE